MGIFGKGQHSNPASPSSTGIRKGGMRFSGALVKGAEVRMVEAFQPAVLHQHLDIAIHRRRVERFHEAAPLVDDLAHRQRPVVLPENLFYDHSLYCFSLQGIWLLSS